MACNTSIHWHGLELDNDSDGTGVSQNRLEEDGTHTYRFFAPRPGVFWFHPHMRPGPQVFSGAYGSFIVRDPNETALQASATIPTADNTHTLVLSDTEFDADGDVGYLDDSNEAVPWATLKSGCEGGSRKDCQNIDDAKTVLVNGNTVHSATHTIKARSGAGIRLRLLNVSTNRYFRLKVSNNGEDNNLYRIGGEGGFLETVRLEGGLMGLMGLLDTKYERGEILVPASGRSDVVVVPTGNHGDIITIEGLEYSRGGPGGIGLSAGDLLYIEIDDNLPSDPAFDIAEGNDVLGAGAIDDLKSLDITDHLIDPWVVAGPGSDDETIRFTGVETGALAIDDVVGEFESSGTDYTQVPFQDATRYAIVGDLLELTLYNLTGQHHPFHHHGFSFQPVRVVAINEADDPGDDEPLYEFDYSEFVDVIDIQNGQGVVVRIRLDTRPRITDNRQEPVDPPANQFFASGGAAGRWVFHCHLFLHAAIGMISELAVFDTDRDDDDFDTSKDCNDFDPAINPAAVEVPDDGVDNNCNGLIDEFEPAFDIKFCSDQNSFNSRRTTGKVPMTLFGTATTGVDEIDLTTLRLCIDGDEYGNVCSSAAPVITSFADRGDPATDVGTNSCRGNTANKDGILDLDIWFLAADICELIDCAGLNKGDISPEISIKGLTIEGDGVQSSNSDILTIKN
jgi:FtsP/CotA-like multicopper oxidase with cupredoxin domain